MDGRQGEFSSATVSQNEDLQSVLAQAMPQPVRVPWHDTVRGVPLVL